MRACCRLIPFSSFWWVILCDLEITRNFPLRKSEKFLFFFLPPRRGSPLLIGIRSQFKLSTEQIPIQYNGEPYTHTHTHGSPNLFHLNASFNALLSSFPPTAKGTVWRDVTKAAPEQQDLEKNLRSDALRISKHRDTNRSKITILGWWRFWLFSAFWEILWQRAWARLSVETSRLGTHNQKMFQRLNDTDSGLNLIPKYHSDYEVFLSSFLGKVSGTFYTNHTYTLNHTSIPWLNFLHIR